MQRTPAILWWAGLDLSLGVEPDAALTDAYAAAWRGMENDDAVSWLSRGAAPANP